MNNTKFRKSLLRTMLVAFAATAFTAGCDSASDEDVEVIPHAGATITASSSFLVWTATNEGGLVTLRSYYPEDSTRSVAQESLTLIDTGEALPEFVGYNLYTLEGLYQLSLSSGTVAIQNFNVEGVMAGYVYGRSSDSSRDDIASPFYVDMSEAGAE